MSALGNWLIRQPWYARAKANQERRIREGIVVSEIVARQPIVKVGDNGTGRACSFCGAVTFGLSERCGACNRPTGIVL